MKFFSRLPFHFWALGFFFINFDRALVIKTHGFHLKLSYLFFFAAWLSVLGIQIKKTGFVQAFKNEMQKATSMPWIFPWLMAIYALAGAPFSVIPVKSIAYSFWLVFDLAVVVGGALELERMGLFSMKIFYRYLAAMVTFMGGVIIIDQIAYYAGFIDGWIGYNQDSLLHWGVSRPHAFTGEPSYAAAFLCLGVVFLLKELVFRKEYLPTWISGAASLIGFLALVFTTARSGWLSFAFTLLLMTVAVVLHFREFTKRIAIALGAASILVIAFVIFTPASQRKVMNDNLVNSVIQLKDGSGNARLNSMIYGWVMAKETNFLGVGIGANYTYWQKVKKEPDRFNGEAPPDDLGRETIMSSWAQVLGELGFPGLILYMCFAVSLITFLLRPLVSHNSAIHGIAVLSAVVFFLFTAHWLSNFCRTDVWVWFALWGVIARMRGQDPDRAS